MSGAPSQFISVRAMWLVVRANLKHIRLTFSAAVFFHSIVHYLVFALCTIVTIATPLHAATAFYVAASRSANGDGSAANPWKGLDNINWTTIQTALASGEVNVYLSSRDSWPNIGTISIGASGSASGWLKVIGNAYYCTGATGTATWTAESSPYSAATNTGNLATTTSTGSGWSISNGQHYIRLEGVWIQNSSWGGINLEANANPTVNIDHIQIVGCKVTSPVNNHGIWFGYAETGCHDILISGNYVYGTQLEAIYMGHYSYLEDTITGVVVENNVVVDCGLSGQGDIDIKPGCYGAIVRGNTQYRTSSSITGTTCGVVVAADACQIYNNKFYTSKGDTSDWGYGIYVNAEGAALGVGKGINSCLIYNNLIYGSYRSGIKILATTSTSGADVIGVKIWNNTIWGNSEYGIVTTASNGRSVVVAELKNNIIGGNTLTDLNFASGSSITTADYNLIYRTSGTLITYGGSNRTWAQWKALGFDAHGINADPQFNNAAAGDFTLATGSPATGIGVIFAPSSAVTSITAWHPLQFPSGIWSL